MLRLRPARLDDIDALLPLLAQLFSIEQDFTPDSAKQRRGLELLIAKDDAFVLLAEAEAMVVGMATLQTLISTAEGGPCGLIEDVVVAEGHRGLGIGRALMQGVIDWASERGLSRLQLLADRDNRPALDFYLAQGWSGTQLIAMRNKLLPRTG